MCVVREPFIWVVKIGSNALCDPSGHLDLLFLSQMAGQIAHLVEAGCWPIIVSSGAVASGMAGLRLEEAPQALSDRQALAAIGQAGLVHRWQVALAGHHLQGAQILLTDDDFQHRQRYLNLAATLRSLRAYGVIPIVNENDTISVAELTVGDNDRLSAMLASQLGAQRLVLLTDIDGVYSADPRSDPQAHRLSLIQRIDQSLIEKMGSQGRRGRGGMRSKVEAAQLAGYAGVETIIAAARHPEILPRLLAGQDLGTRVLAGKGAVPSSRRRWLALARRVRGQLSVDQGAASAIRESGYSLLPAGIKSVEGTFARGDTVSIRDQQGQECARGLSAFASDELTRIIGLRMDEAAEVLGYPLPKVAVHRDNMLLSDAS